MTRKRGGFTQALSRGAGYTLIEIIVVISIIGLVMTSALYAVNVSRMKSRDAKRMADLDAMRKAVELYYDDNGKYPNVNGSALSSATSGLTYINWQTLKGLLRPYLNELPVDPINIGNPFWDGGYAYQYRNNGSPQIYDLITQLEDDNNENICKYKCQTYYASGQPWCEPFYCGAGSMNYSNNIYTNH